MKKHFSISIVLLAFSLLLAVSCQSNRMFLSIVGENQVIEAKQGETLPPFEFNVYTSNDELLPSAEGKGLVVSGLENFYSNPKDANVKAIIKSIDKDEEDPSKYTRAVIEVSGFTPDKLTATALPLGFEVPEAKNGKSTIFKRELKLVPLGGRVIKINVTKSDISEPGDTDNPGDSGDVDNPGSEEPPEAEKILVSVNVDPTSNIELTQGQTISAITVTFTLTGATWTNAPDVQIINGVTYTPAVSDTDPKVVTVTLSGTPTDADTNGTTASFDIKDFVEADTDKNYVLPDEFKAEFKVVVKEAEVEKTAASVRVDSTTLSSLRQDKVASGTVTFTLVGATWKNAPDVQIINGVTYTPAISDTDPKVVTVTLSGTPTDADTNGTTVSFDIKDFVEADKNNNYVIPDEFKAEFIVVVNKKVVQLTVENPSHPLGYFYLSAETQDYYKTDSEGNKQEPPIKVYAIDIPFKLEGAEIDPQLLEEDLQADNSLNKNYPIPGTYARTAISFEDNAFTAVKLTKESDGNYILTAIIPVTGTDSDSYFSDAFKQLGGRRIHLLVAALTVKDGWALSAAVQGLADYIYNTESALFLGFPVEVNCSLKEGEVVSIAQGESATISFNITDGVGIATKEGTEVASWSSWPDKKFIVGDVAGLYLWLRSESDIPDKCFLTIEVDDDAAIGTRDFFFAVRQDDIHIINKKYSVFRDALYLGYRVHKVPFTVEITSKN